MHSRWSKRVAVRDRVLGESAAIFAFDLLWLDGADRQRLLFERKAALDGGRRDRTMDDPK